MLVLHVMDVSSNKSVLITTSANAPEIKVDEALALKWLNDGAKPTDTVHNILSKEGIMKNLTNKRKLSNLA